MIFPLIISALTLSLLPALIFSAIYLREGTVFDLNRRFFVKLAAAGAAAVIPAAILIYLITPLFNRDITGLNLLYPYLGVSLTEESLKIIILYLMLYRSSDFRNVNDGIAYGAAIAIGFSAAENILYQTGARGPVILIALRALTAVPLHTLCGGYMGYYAAQMKFNAKPSGFLSLLVPVMLHGTYNLLLKLPTPLPYLIFPLLMSAAYFQIKIVMRNNH